ncbi:MAG: winged helix-turn-helix domain-containing protein [Acholeplasmataceae bacterium]
MKLEFNKSVSRILDYLVFPRLYYFIDEEDKENEETFGSLIREDFMTYVEEVTKAFAPYKDTIEKYYQKDIYANIDFIQIVINAYPPYGYTDEKAYLNDLLNIDDLEFRRSFIKALLIVDEEDKHKMIDEKMIDESHAIQYINQLKIDASNKWNMLIMVQDPKKCLKEFVSLLDKVEPLFNNCYQHKADEVEQVGLELSKKLSGDTSETLKRMSFNAVNYDFGDNDSCQLYVSAIFPYTLRFIETEPCKIVWGLEMEYSFQKLHELNEDKMVQRVKVFKALGDKTRYDTIRLIASGVSSIKDIATKLDVSSATISYHINEFLTSGIISLNRKKDKKSIYDVDYQKLEDVLSELRVDLKFPL